MIIKLNRDSLNTKKCDKSIYWEFMCISPKKDWLLMIFYAKKGLLIKVQYFYRSEDIALICYSFMLERGTKRQRKERDCIKKKSKG